MMELESVNVAHSCNYIKQKFCQLTSKEWSKGIFQSDEFPKCGLGVDNDGGTDVR
jgi:hypothetical protein